MEKTNRYIVTVEFEVFADSPSNAVRQYFIGKDRFLTVKNVKKMEDTEPNTERYLHEQDFYDEAGDPVEFVLPDEDENDVLFWIPLDGKDWRE